MMCLIRRNNMTMNEIVKEIINNGYEEEVTQILLQKIFEDNRCLRRKNADCRVRLKMIRNINNKKNNAIDVLCEL